MKKIIFFFVLLFIPFVISAKHMEIDWQESIGGSSGDDVNVILVTDDNESVVIFTSSSTDIEGIESKGSSDIYIYKYDEKGNVIWKRNWGGNGAEWVASAILTKEDDIVFILRNSNSTDLGLENKGDIETAVVKYDKDGNLLWQKSISGSNSDMLQSIVELSDGSVVVVGRTKSTDIEGLNHFGSFDVMLFKYDKDGNLLWNRVFGGTGWDESVDAKIDGNDNIIISGFTKSGTIDGMKNHGGYDTFLYKYDKDGNLLWKDIYGGSLDDRLYNLFITSNNEIIIYGSFYSTDINGLENKGDQDVAFVKYSKDGQILLQRGFGGCDYDYISKIIEDKDNNLIVTGSSSSTDIDNFNNNGSSAAYILKYDKNGNIINNLFIDGDASDSASFISPINDENYVVVGTTMSSKIGEYENHGSIDAYISIIDKNFEIISLQMWGGSGTDAFNSEIIYKNNNLFFFTEFLSNDIDNLISRGSQDIALIKYSLNYDVILSHHVNGSPIVKQIGLNGIITPTPNDGYEVDKIIVKDTSGYEISVTSLDDGTYSFPLYDDVNIEVLYKKKVIIENPKTGVKNITGLMFTILLILVSGLFVLKNYNKGYEL